MTGPSNFGVRTWAALAVVSFVTGIASSAEPAATTGPPTASLYSHTTAKGETIFAVALRAEKLPSTRPTAHDHVVLVDTSASQVGEHRQQAFDVLVSFLAALPAEDRVCLFAVDVKSQQLTDGFVSPTGDAVQQATNQLNKRVPLGATNLYRALSAALDTIDSRRRTSILVIGDGMSTASLIQSPELQQLLDKLRTAQVPVHSYAVGPKTDLHLLGTLAQQTGGVVLFDRADEERDRPEIAGRKLAAAARAPVFYPKTIHVDPALSPLLPRIALPIRADRETIYLGKGNPSGELGVRVTGSFDGGDMSLEWKVTAENAPTGYSALGALWRLAERDDGLSVSLAGLPLLHAAQNAFDDRVAQWVAMGEQAVAARNLDEAEKIGLEIQKFDPNNRRAKVMMGRVNKLKVRTIALAQPGGSLLDQVPELQKGAPPPETPESSMILQEEERRRIKTEAMKLQVERAIQEGRQLAQDDPDAALSMLKERLGSVTTAHDIEPDAQQALTKRMRNVIQEVVNLKSKIDLDKIRAAEREAQLEAEQQLVSQLQKDDELLENYIDQVRALLERGRHGDDNAYETAEEVAEIAVDMRPGAGIAESARFTSEAAGALNKAFRLRALRADRFLETLHQVELSHVPFPDEPPIRWPPAAVWQQLTQRRKKWASVDLHKNSPIEERIQAALREETETGFVDTPLSEAIGFLSDFHDITIMLDEPALTEEGLGTDEPINLDVAGITLRSALRIMLEPLQLTYVIEDEVMKITTQVKADEKLTTRVYPVGDLVIPIITPQSGGIGSGLGGAGGFGGGGGGFGGGGGGFGGGGFGGGGRGGGGGFFSLPPANLPNANKAVRPKNRAKKPIADREIRGILNKILGGKTSRIDHAIGQAFAQVKDSLPQKTSNVFDNAAVEALKKKDRAIR